MRAERLMRTSYFLEAVTSGACASLALRRHEPAADLENVLANVPIEIRSALTQDASMLASTKDLAVREVSEMRAKMGINTRSNELRCGILFGVGSAAYHQAKASWAELTNQEKPTWERP